MLPTQFQKSAKAQHNPEQLTYNNQSIDISDPSNYRPNDDTAFHRYTPDLNGGRLRNLDKNNNLIPNFNLAQAANKSCLLYANKIKDFVMGLVLTPERRRTAFWKALCLPQLSKMVKSYGLTTKSMNIGLLVAANVQRFIQYSRTSDSRYGRGSDAQRTAVNAVAAAIVNTPQKKSNDNGLQQSSNTTQQPSSNKISRREACRFLNIPEGSHRLLAKCGEFRLAAKEGLDRSFIFLGPKKPWKKIAEEVWTRFRRVYLPGHPHITDIPSKKETVFMREEWKLLFNF